MASSCVHESNGLQGIRLSAVKGDANKVNDVYVYGKISGSKEHIVYFGGDVQDYAENMEKHRDHKRYVEWNTEATAAKLQRKFPDSLVFAIKASKMHLLTFAVYSNFIDISDCVAPVHSEDYGGVRHLATLYKNILRELREHENRKGSSKETDVPVRIIGFSKGCTVLNQIVFELPAIHKDPVANEFMQKVISFYWLDGGHSGGVENTWVTADAPLQHLARLNSDIHIHVTPYQVRDPMRKWIGQQKSKFHKKLKGFGANVEAYEHFDKDPPSLENHFRVLEEFR